MRKIIKIKTYDKSQWEKVFKGIDIFDIEEAFFRYDGNLKLYLEQIKNFKIRINTFSEQLNLAVELNDCNEIDKVNHALKNVSGILAQKKLYELSSELERDIRENKIFKFGIYLDILEELKNTGLSIASISIEKKDEGEKIYNDEELKMEFKHLIDLLEDYDADAEEVFENIVPSLSYRYSSSEIENLKDLMSSYEFNRAFHLCKNIYSSLFK